VDWFLQSLVSIVNDESASIPITLSIGSLLISGDMIGGKTYFSEFARQFKDGFRGIGSETAATIEEAFKRLGDIYDPVQKESQGNASIQKPHIIHLRDARIYHSGGNPSPSEKGVLWRGRLEAVDGFSLGKHSLDLADVMIESNFAALIDGVCREAGKNKGIEFHPPVAWGAPVPGRWEVSCRPKQQGWSVTLIYWLSSDSWLSEDVFWDWGFRSGREQSEQFKSDISTKLDQMLEWVGRE
jgi:hypothetical protein